MVKEIPLSKGMIAIVDDCDYVWLSEWKWCVSHQGYAMRTEYIQGSGRKHQMNSVYLMHRIIMNAPEGMCVDHINRDKLDNRRSNLRLATRAENLWNAGMSAANTSGYRGVYWLERRKCWLAKIFIQGKEIRLGQYDEAIDAAYAYNVAALKYMGSFAYQNKLPEGGIVTGKQIGRAHV